MNARRGTADMRMEDKPDSTSTTGASLRARILAVVASLALVAAVGAVAARAGSCRVLLALGSVEFEPSPAGFTVRVGGNWEFDNLVQVVSGLSFNMLFIRGDSFIRLQYPNSAWYGTVAGLGSALDAGLTGADILSIEAASITEPRARFASVEAQRMKIVLPPPPPSVGPASVVAYMILDGDYNTPILSNTVTQSLKNLDAWKTKEPSTDGRTPSGGAK